MGHNSTFYWRMRMKVAILAVLVFAAAVVVAQDTNYCSDGWDLFTVEAPNGETHHLCFLFGQENEQMSHDNAKLICEARGGFLAEVPFGPLLNTWITDKLLEKMFADPSTVHSTGLEPGTLDTTTNTCLAPGCGKRGTRRSTGLTGETVNQTTSTARTV